MNSINLFSSWGLRKKLILSYLLVVLIPVTTLGVLSYYKAKSALFNEIKLKLEKGVSQYHDAISLDLKYANQNLGLEKELVIERFTDKLRAEKVGKTGYMYTMDLTGTLLVHPTSEGKNIAKHKFIQEMIQKKSGFIDYHWEGRKKIVAFTYYKEKGWIIASGSYLSDFEGPIIDIRNLILVVLAISITLVVIFAIYLSSSIVTPILNIVKGVDGSSLHVSQASIELANSSNILASSTNQQAASLEETSASLEEMTGMVKSNTDSSKECAELSASVNSSSEEGNHLMHQLIGSMEEILKSNDEIMSLVSVISEIGEKTKVIDEIVFQTKLLSFNASVEAERAGEHGRGFAVVAQEVGNLAQMSSKAALEISTIVNTSIKSAETVAGENKNKVEAGNEMVRGAAKILDDISKNANTVLTSIEKVLSASEDQSIGINQINIAVSHLDKATQNNASTSEEAASASEELSQQAEHLKNMVIDLNKVVAGTSKKDNTILPREGRNNLRIIPNNNIEVIKAKDFTDEDDQWKELA